MDPHGPYFPAERCRAPFDPAAHHEADEPSLPLAAGNYGRGIIPRYQAIGDERAPSLYRARYDGEIRCTDEHVATPVALLHTHGLWEDALVQSVGLIDIAPTVLDLLGIPRPDGMEGTSLRPLFGGDGPDRTAFAQTYYGDGLVVLRRGPTKYIFTPPPPVVSRIPAREELYDLTADPGELHDLAATEGDRVRELRRSVEAWLATQDPAARGPDAADAPRDPPSNGSYAPSATWTGPRAP
jgi:arylsulfatase A-like enzyme